jgi:hypothetical protein
MPQNVNESKEHAKRCGGLASEATNPVVEVRRPPLSRGEAKASLENSFAGAR